MRFLLDTCVISELVAKQPDPGVVRWIDDIGEEKLYLSAITIGEIRVLHPDFPLPPTPFRPDLVTRFVW
jgi:hypothetical protein